MAGYAELLAGFRASDEAREQLFGDIVKQLENLQIEHDILKIDFEDERNSRRGYQRSIAEHQSEAAEYKRQFDGSSFILGLIDGDGAIFQDALLQAASSGGGSEAASRLHQAIRNHLASIYPDSNSGHWPVVVQIYLSLDKLAQKLWQVGLCQTPHDMRTFVQQFNMNQPLFSVIDVGQGKENADHKIRETLRSFIDNPTCRHIVFSGCHDSGYLNNLGQFKHDIAKASRVTLLETTPAHKSFAGLDHFRRARFENIFRSEPLPDQASQTNYAVQPSVKSAVQPPLLRTTTNVTSLTPMRKQPISVPSPSVTPALTESSEDSSWAGVSKSGAPPNGAISMTPAAVAPTAAAKKGNKNKKWAYYNKDGERLDLALPAKVPGAAASLEARMKRGGKKMCNHWHLGGKCENGPRCHFQHEPKLSADELNVLRYKTRSLACHNIDCENVGCYLGHQCANEREIGYCSFNRDCNLSHRHNMDSQKYVKYDRDGNFEYVS